MIDSDKAQCFELIAGLAETFGRSLSKPGLLAYWVGLRDLDLRDVKRGFLKSMETSRFMPSVAEFRELAGVDTASQRAIKAWMIVSEAAGRIGSYKSVHFQDAAINAAIRSLGGWPELLAKSGEEFDKWARQDFIRIYQAIESNCFADSEQCRPLGGLQSKQENIQCIKCDYVIPKQLQSLPAQKHIEYMKDKGAITNVRAIESS